MVLFLRPISTYCIRLGTEVAVLNSQGVPISQVGGLKDRFHSIYLKVIIQDAAIHTYENQSLNKRIKAIIIYRLFYFIHMLGDIK